MLAGLTRLGLASRPPGMIPGPFPGLAAAHGPLMIGGFLGTLISLERAVGLGAAWVYAAPLLSACGAVLLVLGHGAPAAAAALAASAVLVGAQALIVRRAPAAFTVTLLLGAACWLAGNGLWLAGKPLFSAAPWWLGFPVLTIAGERLELSRMTAPPRAARWLFAAATAAFLGGLVLDEVTFGIGSGVSGAALTVLALWLWRYDLARRTVRLPGLPRFTALCLLSGYVWLAAGGALWWRQGGLGLDRDYDATIHALMLGFAFSMIFAHAPMILPAVIGVPLPFSRAFYGPPMLLQLSLAVRVAGDLAGREEWRAGGGLVNVLAILFFLANNVRALRAGKRQAHGT